METSWKRRKDIFLSYNVLNTAEHWRCPGPVGCCSDCHHVGAPPRRIREMRVNKRHRSIRSLTCMIFIMITWNVRCSIFCSGQGLRHFTSASEGTEGQPCHLPRLSYKPSLWPWMGTTAGYHVFGLGIKEIGERRHQCVTLCAQPCQHSQKRKQSLPRHTAEGNFLGKTQSLYENICLKRNRCTSLSMHKKHASFFLERGARV